MFLKSIRAQGFKSFADKLDIEINKGITGVVGPNGSGKSNIVDAVRWVLGEQSVKSLRGSTAMSDVIFSGSDSREAQKRAMVALTFDNSDYTLNSPFDEIEIKRVVYNTGENEYFINNAKVRLKDITDLFIESGAGNNAFNIISQGNVTDIVNSKSHDRRVIFESAAGVLKYKKRKEESLRKLERTEENLVRIKLIIDELATTVEPLKEQSIKAQKYLDLSSELKNIDIALMCQDITSINKEYKELKTITEILKNKLDNFINTNDEAKLEKMKLHNLELEDLLNNKKENLLNLTQEIAELNSEKQITIERQKYVVNKDSFNEQLLTSKEEELALKSSLDVIKSEVEKLESKLNKEKEELDEISNKEISLKVKQSTLNNTILDKNKEIFVLQNKINILENNILNDAILPSAVKSILNNPRLDGIHNTIGKLIDVDDKYLVALDTALGYNKNFVVVDNELSASNAISFLKEQKLGRVTFFPLNIIKSRNVDNNTIKSIESIKGYIGILSNLISYDEKYRNIIENQLGNVIIVNDTNTLNIIGKLIDYKYRIVTLDGEILHVGGSITGGISKQNNILNEKKELNKLKQDEQDINMEVAILNNELNDINKELSEVSEKAITINKEINLITDELYNKKQNMLKKEELYKDKTKEISGINSLMDDTINNKLMELIELMSNKEKERLILEKEIKNINDEKNDLIEDINELDKQFKETNNEYYKLQNELKEKEVKIAKLEVQLDNLLVDLSEEYNMTYEYASATYLDESLEIDRSRVNQLKKDIAKLGDVNTGAIAEYERLSKRYDFLFNQKEDLEKSSNELMSIIEQMDTIMIEKFAKAFEQISKHFTDIFKLMFKGGKGELLLTDPDDLLNTGIDIIAVPPGKKINNTLLLSGGEKALTAICLLFAMLEYRPAPFIILDEAEAALDEANVDMFGKYLQEQKDKSQFIVITHKKRMMEYADSLYGITMQESGVSKIVSARLEQN